MSIASAFGTGLNILTQLAGARNALQGGGSILAAGMQMPSIRVPQQIVNTVLPALPGSGYSTGGGFGTTASGQHWQTGMALQRPPVGYHYARDGSGRIVRNRRMNPLNASAARRAIRRIKGARKMLRSIENSLPKRAASKSTRKR